ETAAAEALHILKIRIAEVFFNLFSAENIRNIETRQQAVQVLACQQFIQINAGKNFVQIQNL
ncbi:MAG: hypothetical protein IKL31_02575, partial [Ruminococcus sp.]|nr:hypothetical protein [Ruminococcus sp.]